MLDGYAKSPDSEEPLVRMWDVNVSHGNRCSALQIKDTADCKYRTQLELASRKLLVKNKGVNTLCPK
jgi:hypothetical protein